MNAIALLLDKARMNRSLATDLALADFLHVKRQTVSLWRKGTAYPEEDRIAQLAELAGDDPAVWFVTVKVERATGEAAKVWRKIAKQMSIAACLAIAVALGGIHEAKAATTAEPGVVQAIHYAQLLMRRFRAWLAGGIGRLRVGTHLAHAG